MTTQKTALAAARRRWGKRALVREDRRALSPALRQQRRDHVAAINLRIKEIGTELQSHGDTERRLLEAAEFFLSVNGDEPSGSQLRSAVELSRKMIDLVDERRAITEERDRIRWGCHSFRWQAGYVMDLIELGSGVAIHESADTLDELIAKIEKRGAETVATASM